jgi:hypothetical protein
MVSHSSAEAEYKVVANATVEIVWVQSLLRELGISQNQSFDVINIAAMYLSSNPVFLAHTKHIEVHFHFVREQATQKLLQIKFISSQLADIFTKSLPLPTFEGCRCNLNLLSISGHS